MKPLRSLSFLFPLRSDVPQSPCFSFFFLAYFTQMTRARQAYAETCCSRAAPPVHQRQQRAAPPSRPARRTLVALRDLTTRCVATEWQTRAPDATHGVCASERCRRRYSHHRRRGRHRRRRHRCTREWRRHWFVTLTKTKSQWNRLKSCHW